MNLNKPIGGYFNLEINLKNSFIHSEAVALNTGRNAFEYILLNLDISFIYLPYYMCEVLLQPIHKVNINYKFYHLNKNLYPIIDKAERNKPLLFINYFGLLNNQIEQLEKEFSTLIIDNSQAFFSSKSCNYPSFYSARKFFGVPDGGFAYVDNNIENNFEVDKSSDRMMHLLRRTEEEPESAFSYFKANEKKLDNLPIKKMSILTQNILQSIDYEHVKIIRNKNFEFLHTELGKMNEFSNIIEKEPVDGPMAYPFLCAKNEKLTSHLIDQRIFIPRYWQNVGEWLKREDCYEMYLLKNLIPIPIDQRYGLEEMKIIVDYIKDYYFD